MPLMPDAISALWHANTSTNGNSIIVRRSGNTVIWYSTQTYYACMQMNSKSLYHVLAFYQADAE